MHGAGGRAVGQIAPSRPPEEFVEVDTWVLDSTAELSALRAAVHRAITDDEIPGEATLPGVPEKMVLVASELATNALRHAAPPTVVQLAHARSEYLLDVADHDPGTPPVVVSDRPAGGGGLGLQLAQQLSVDVGWYTSGDAKHVWATFPAGRSGRGSSGRPAPGTTEARSA